MKAKRWRSEGVPQPRSLSSPADWPAGPLSEPSSPESFAALLVQAQEEERRRISQDLHDSLGQKVAAILWSLPAEKDQSLKHSEPAWIRSCRAALESVMAEIRSTSHQLHPSIVEHLGLEAALHALCRQLKESTGIDFALAASPDLPELDRQTALALYRIAQAALVNAVKHAAATRVSTHLVAGAGRIALTIEDNGRGFSRAQETGGIGIAGMRERTRLLGGTCSITSASSEGTRLEFRIPLHQPEAAHLNGAKVIPNAVKTSAAGG